jgi:hypothetical protein
MLSKVAPKKALETEKIISQDGTVVWGIAVGCFNNHHHTRKAWGDRDKRKIAIGAKQARCDQ